MSVPNPAHARCIHRIGIVGGVDRTMVLHARAAATIGCELEHHDGHMRGRAADVIAAMVERVDLLVILTDTNSHSAVHVSRKLASARGRRHVLTRRISPGRLVQLVAQVEAEASP